MASILVIEDDSSLRDTLRIHLSSAGYSVRVAADATEAIRAILAGVPDLILSDVTLPYMDGFELLEVLRRDESTRSTPVILLTGLVDDDNYVKGIRLGATAYLTKPVLRDELLKTISGALRGAARKAEQQSGG
jgi:DNA-binding response OmpR family regulator